MRDDKSRTGSISLEFFSCSVQSAVSSDRPEGRDSRRRAQIAMERNFVTCEINSRAAAQPAAQPVTSELSVQQLTIIFR